MCIKTIYLEDVVDLVVVDADVEQQAAAVLEVLLAVSAGVGGVQQVLVVLLQQAHEVGAVVVLQQDHCNKFGFFLGKVQKIFAVLRKSLLSYLWKKVCCTC